MVGSFHCFGLKQPQTLMVSPSPAIKEYRQMACKVTNDLYRKVNSIITNGHLNQNATLYFSHENLLSKVISYLDLFDHFPHFTEHNASLCLPEQRQWRASNILSFGTNFATVLYKCDQPPEAQASVPGSNRAQSYRMLTLLNELPVTIRGCSSPFCPVQEFFNEFHTTLDNCDLNAICK